MQCGQARDKGHQVKAAVRHGQEVFVVGPRHYAHQLHVHRLLLFRCYRSTRLSSTSLAIGDVKNSISRRRPVLISAVTSNPGPSDTARPSTSISRRLNRTV